MNEVPNSFTKLPSPYDYHNSVKWAPLSCVLQMVETRFNLGNAPSITQVENDGTEI